MKGRPTPRRRRPIVAGFADRAMTSLQTWAENRRDEQRRERDEANAWSLVESGPRVVPAGPDDNRKPRDRSLRGKHRIRARKSARREAQP